MFFASGGLRVSTLNNPNNVFVVGHFGLAQRLTAGGFIACGAATLSFGPSARHADKSWDC
jgi:hypothetical protein